VRAKLAAQRARFPGGRIGAVRAQQLSLSRGDWPSYTNPDAAIGIYPDDPEMGGDGRNSAQLSRRDEEDGVSDRGWYCS
jgi:hypothetical protein